MFMRDLLILLETINARQDPSEVYIEAVTAAIGYLPVQVHLIPEAHSLVEIHTIDAENPGQGSGTRAMTTLTELADRYGIELTLEVEFDRDDEDEDSEGTWDDEEPTEAPERATYMSADQLVGWYARYGFQPVSSHGGRLRLNRAANSTES
jgi:hypothetical protein